MRNTPFNRLTISQQADLLLKEGYFLDSREEPGFFVDMYQLHGMYIEIYYHKRQEDFVVMKSFYSSEDVCITSTENSDCSLPVGWQTLLMPASYMA